MSKLQDTRKIVQKYGQEYGWEWSKETGLINRALTYGQSFLDQWNIIDDAKEGQGHARELIDAIQYLSKYELSESARAIRHRKTRLAPVEQLYQQRALDLIDKQLNQLRTETDETMRVLQIQNIHREGSENAFRQTPKQRSSRSGISARAKHSVVQLDKALHSDELLVKAETVTLDDYEALKEVAQYFGVNLDEIAERHKVAEGDPYKALDKAYIEVSETIHDSISQLGPDEYAELMASPVYAKMVMLYGIDF